MNYIVDIDGTIADCTWRRHLAESKQWDAFFEGSGADKPIDLMHEMLQDISRGYYNTFIYVSGRPERIRTITERWLKQYDFPEGKLYMRTDGDRRDDTIIKQEILAQLVTDGLDKNWTMAFDDRTRIVNMWRENGIKCLQVAAGDF